MTDSISVTEARRVVERAQRCKRVVWGSWGRPRPCTREAVKDGFCKQHHPESVKVQKDARHTVFMKSMEGQMEMMRRQQRYPILLVACANACEATSLEAARKILTEAIESVSDAALDRESAPGKKGDGK
jgi:hypothetical protein